MENDLKTYDATGQSVKKKKERSKVFFTSDL